MSIKITASGGDFEPLPEGNYTAICYKIVDQGTREEQFKDNPKKKRHTLNVSWEIPSEKMADGRPMSISKTYTVSLNENATLYKDLVTWRGTSFTKEELEGFEIDKMIGAPATLEVEHVNEKARIKAIFKPDEFKKTATQNNPIIFDLNLYCDEFNGNTSKETKEMCDVFDTLPEWQQTLIEESFELLAAKDSDDAEETSSGGEGLADLANDKKENDDIPF